MPVIFTPEYVEGKVYRSRRKQDDGEKQALSELQTILSSKNRRSCDCEAQVHDLVENCLNCGRLTCESEGPGKCFSCDSIVLRPDQRERFKKHIDIFQGTTTSMKQPTGARTRIIDNQFDHFAIDNKKHLSGADRRKLKKDLEELQSQRYQKKMMLNINVDHMQAGTSAVPQVEDYNEEMRKLQLKDNASRIQSSLLLADLVQQESKKKYAFEFVKDKKHK